MSSSKAIFTPLTLRGLTLKNRLVVSPMCQYSATDGLFNDWHLVHLGSRAVGGYGLVMTEATAVCPEGRITSRDTGLWHDGQVAPLRRIAEFVRSVGSVPGVQLAHAGRKASATPPFVGGGHHLRDDEAGGWETVAPSAVAFGSAALWKVPRAMSLEEIRAVEDQFAAAARRAVAAGMGVIEIHAAHGYLLHEFCSPLSNKRTDAYGGSLENRTRILVEIVRKVRAVIPQEMPLFVRLTGTDWHPEGWRPEDAVATTRVLKANGVDLVDVSTGLLIPNYKDVPVSRDYQVQWAALLRREAGVATGAVGQIDEVDHAEEVVREGKADLVFQARESLRNPYFPFQAAEKFGVRSAMREPAQYERRIRSGL